MMQFMYHVSHQQANEIVFWTVALMLFPVLAMLTYRAFRDGKDV